MTKPIHRLEFWEQRIHDAMGEGDLRRSVYKTTEEDWQLVNAQHATYLREHISEDDVVLEVGCGYGRASEFIPGRIYVGIDFCQQFIHLARKRYPNRLFHVLNANNLTENFAAGVFDWCVCIGFQDMVITNLSKDAWEKMLKQMKKVAKKGVISLEYGNRTGTTSCLVYNEEQV